MALSIQVNPKDPCIDIHTGRGQGSCTFANGFNCVCSCAGIAHAQLLRMVLTPENSKELPDKYKQALANKVQTVQARIADIPHDKVTTIIHAQKQPKRVFSFARMWLIPSLIVAESLTYSVGQEKPPSKPASIKTLHLCTKSWH